MSTGARSSADGLRRRVLTSAVDYPTTAGLAHLVLDVPSRPSAVLLLGHGAGGDIDAPDLVAVRDVAVAAGVAVVRVRQPYRVAGRKAPAPAAALDLAFTGVITGVGTLPGLSRRVPVLVGGRSSGARVAARSASAVGAVGLLALAFPLTPPGKLLVTRIDELAGAGVPTLVVQGGRDPFGSGAVLRSALAAVEVSDVEVVDIADADHAFRTRARDSTTTADALAAIRTAVQAWLAGLVTGR